MLLFKKYSAVKEFRGTTYFSWLNFRGKVYMAAIIFLAGILVQGFMILLAETGSEQELIKENKVHEQTLAEIKYIAGLSPTILSRCQAGLTEGAVVETSDIRESLALGLKGLNKLLKKGQQSTVLNKNYQLLNQQLERYNNSALSMPQYLKIKRLYNKYVNSLTTLKQNLNQYRGPQISKLLNHRELLLIAICLLVFTLSLTGILLISAVQSIVIPAKIMAKIFSEAKQKIFEVEIPITSTAGLGNAALILKESLRHWNTKLLDSKNSICQLDNLCNELVTEIRKTELFAIQLQTVAEELTENFTDQNKLTAGAHNQLAVLVNNSEELHRVPQRLMVIHDDLKAQLATVQGQVQQILNQTFEYKDESREIADLADNLNVASEKVNGVILILNDVAERTELLAFNTAIQAARAGEKGLGFGVVAKEIAKLVDYSKKASLQLSDTLRKINGKNDYILKLITEYSEPSNVRAPIYEEVAKICADIFETAQTNFDNIKKLTKVMEVVFTNSNRLSGEVHQISRLTDEENTGTVNFDLETLDYQLNVKEANRIALRVSELSDELRVLAETAVGEEKLVK